MSAIKYISLMACSFPAIVLFSCLQCTAFETGFFIDTPDQEVYSHEGSDVTLEWQFKIGSWSASPNKVREFLFGVWREHGYVKKKIVSVREHDSIKILSYYERKVDWAGNIYDCSDCNATIKMHNLTAADFKTYGVEVEPQDLKKMPLKNWLTIVKFVRAKIVKWRTDIKVEEGNATIVICEATGRPTPTVIIQRENHLLCNSTGQCKYDIPAANKSVHEGEYYCLVQQRNSRQIKRSLNLTVIPVTNLTVIPATNLTDNRTKKSQSTLDGWYLAALFFAGITLFLFGLAIWLTRSYRLVKRRRNENKKKEATEAINCKVESLSKSSSTVPQVVFRHSKKFDDDKLLPTQLELEEFTMN